MNVIVCVGVGFCLPPSPLAAECMLALRDYLENFAPSVPDGNSQNRRMKAAADTYLCRHHRIYEDQNVIQSVLKKNNP